MNIPGRQTRREIMSAAWPAPSTWVHAGMRLTLAGLAYVAGAPHVAKIIAVLAVLVLLGAVEARVAEAITGGIKRLWDARLNGSQSVS